MNRKKVGILTFHDADNLGAVLQAFALQSVLTDKCGVSAEIVNYKCKKILSTKFPQKPSGLKDLIKLPFMWVYYLSKRRGFDKFRKQNLQLSMSYDRESIKNNPPAYDIFISGSDQVWNPECSGNDYSYFLDFVKNNALKVSYAASIGRHKYTDFEAEKVSELLKEFNAISVREESAKKELDRIGAKGVLVNSDPVVLLTPNEWQSQMPRRLYKKPYVLVYLVLPDQTVLEGAKKYASEHHLKVICNKESIEFILHNSPGEFLSWVYNAECVFTNSFHGTAFSLIFNKPLAAEVELISGGVNNRVSDFLAKTGAENCILNKNEIKALLPNATASLSEMREAGIDFLRKQCE